MQAHFLQKIQMPPLDFWSKNSYYLTVRLLLLNCFCSPAGTELVTESKYILFVQEEFKVKNKSPRNCCLQSFEFSDKATKQFTVDCGL